MKFLCVFCVVLYLQSGASSQPRNNEFDQIYQQQQQNKGSGQFYFQRNAGIPANLAYNFNRNPSEVNLQRQMTTEQQTVRGRNINEPYLRQGENIGLGAQDFSSQFIRTKLFERNNQPILRENNILVAQQAENLKIQPIRQLENVPVRPEVDSMKQNVRTEFSTIPFVRKYIEPSIKSDEGVRLELQGVSPEYIKSLIDKQNIQKQETSQLSNSYRNIDVDNLKHLPTQPNYEKYQTVSASFQNPSAESLYKLGRALPYRINSQQFSNTPQANTYLQNILTNSKRIQDIYASKQPTKRYTIVYPDGKIEQIDQIESVIATNPNYVLIKAEDVMKHIQNTPNVLPELQVSTIKQNSPINPSIINKPQSNAIDKENNKGSNISPETQIIQKSPVFNNSTPLKENTSIPLSKIIFQKAIDKPDVISLSDSKIESHGPDMISQNKTISVLTMNTTEKNPSTSPDTTIENAKKLQSQNIIDLKPSGIENQNVTVSNVLLNNSPPTLEAVNNRNNFTETIIDTKLTPISNESITLTSLQDWIKKENDTHIPEKVGDLFVSPLSTPLPNNENTTENSPFWFETNEYFWDQLINGNNTQNVYFLFVPPKPITEKEIKTIIYQNGTTVEEVIETKNDGGVPKISKTTTVTHKNETNIYSDD